MPLRKFATFLLIALTVAAVRDRAGSSLRAEEESAAAPEHASPAPLRLTLEDAKQRVLANNKLLQLAALNVQSKGYAIRAMQANYFPQVAGTAVYFHFNDDLGDVISGGGRTIHGPRGRALGAFPAFAVDIPLVQQDGSYSTLTMVQPLTDLLKVRQGVKLAKADEAIAQAQMEKGTRELVAGVEQLFWGLLAAQRIKAGLGVAVGGAEPLAKTGNLEARTALVQAKQGLQQVDNQIADLTEQLTILLDVPTCTPLDLVPPPVPVSPVTCADEAVTLAIETSPEIKEAEQNVCKAQAATAAAKVDYLPNIALVGGYANNNMTPIVQTNIGFAGVMGTYTFVDWGKRKNTVREREQLIAMANLKVQQTQDDVRQKALKTFRDYEQGQVALQLAGELVEVRKASLKAAAELDAKFKAGKDLMTAELDFVKADLNLRFAFVKLMSLIGKQ